MRYKVCSLDVWGNAEIGYEVNDMFSVGTIDIDPSMTDLEVLMRLECLGFLNHLAEPCGDVEWEDETRLHINDKADGRPILTLQAE